MCAWMCVTMRGCESVCFHLIHLHDAVGIKTLHQSLESDSVTPSDPAFTWVVLECGNPVITATVLVHKYDREGQGMKRRERKEMMSPETAFENVLNIKLITVISYENIEVLFQFINFPTNYIHNQVTQIHNSVLYVHMIFFFLDLSHYSWTEDVTVSLTLIQRWKWAHSEYKYEAFKRVKSSRVSLRCALVQPSVHLRYLLSSWATDKSQ